VRATIARTAGIGDNGRTAAGQWWSAYRISSYGIPMRAAEIKKGNVVEHDGKVWQIRDIERSSPQGRGGNVKFRFIMYSVPGAQKLDLSLGSEDDLKETELTRRAVNYSYKDGEAFVFMDSEDYTQYTLDANVVGDAAGYLVDGIEGCYVQLIDDAPVALQLPQSVVLEVIETAPELKGATATKRPKPAKLSTGIEIQVPEYIRTGEKVTVNTVTGEFAGRA
jgi:elongation factor P